jgi:folate-binding protein YgfZ
MNQDWQAFLLQQGAVMDDGTVQHFGDPAAELSAAREGAVLCDLGQFGTLRAAGEDAASFLQNMLSNDVKEVDARRAQLSSLNTPKGRMLATLLIWRDGEDYLLQLPRALCEPLRKKLSMYVLRAKVKISDASDEVVALGVSGGNARELLEKQFGELPEQPFGFVAAGEAGVLKFSDTRFQISTAASNAPTVWQALSAHARPAGSACWDWLNIRAGMPVILPQTQEQFVPQMANLELLGGVSFKKGCYPGQEIVARMQYLGKAKRRMYLAHLDSGTAPAPGDELFSTEAEDQACGMIANVSPAPGGGYDLLAVIQIASREAEAVRWKSREGEALQFLAMPYPLPQD